MTPKKISVTIMPVCVTLRRTPPSTAGRFIGASFASGGTTREKLGRKWPENIMTRPMMVWMIFITGILLAFSIHSLL